jgi:hypothetical protein
MKLSELIKECAETIQVCGDREVEVSLLTDEGSVEFPILGIDLYNKEKSAFLTIDFDNKDDLVKAVYSITTECKKRIYKIQ